MAWVGEGGRSALKQQELLDWPLYFAFRTQNFYIQPPNNISQKQKDILENGNSTHWVRNVKSVSLGNRWLVSWRNGFPLHR